MQDSAVRYARWKAPAEDGQVLLWPEPLDLVYQTLTNHAHLTAAHRILIQNVPLPLVRKGMRQWLGHADDQFLIATGHQAELHHPGVWAKNALIDALAAKVDGRAFHFAVDTDEPKHLSLRWPGGAAPLIDEVSRTNVEWSGLVATPSPAHLTQIENDFERAAKGWDFEPLVPEFIQSMRRLALTSANLPSALAESLHQLDWSLGLRYDAMVVSPICLSEPYLVFVHHVLARADEFGADYNQTLEQYRKQNKIRTPGRPMPNLKLDLDSCEVPFWLDSIATGTRSRAKVVRSGDQWALQSPTGDEFRFDPSADGFEAAGRLLLWFRSNGLRLSPRALTLTAVLRLLVADQFVHGIGGAQYDQVLDALISMHFDLEPPRFSVTTATLYFPGAVGQPRVCLPCLVQDGHRLKHQVLGDEKMQMVEQINRLPRGSSERSQLFFKMHDKLTSAWALPPVVAWEQQFRAAEARAQEERVLFDRELFYAIQPEARLQELIHSYREHLIS
jgi:hypothetical protein